MGGCLDIFTLIYPFSSLSPSLWETTRHRLKYCLKGSLSPKTTNQLLSTTLETATSSDTHFRNTPASGSSGRAKWDERFSEVFHQNINMDNDRSISSILSSNVHPREAINKSIDSIYKLF